MKVLTTKALLTVSQPLTPSVKPAIVSRFGNTEV